jgi:hypothetical protein
MIMESCAEELGIMKKLGDEQHSARDCSDLTSIGVPAVPFFDRFLFLVKAIVEYAFGIQMGLVTGWYAGLFVGNACREHYEPLYFTDLNEIRPWELLPYQSAKNGAVIVSIVGVILIAIINHMLRGQRVVSLYEKSATDPKDIARALGKSERQIQRMTNKLAKKEKYLQKANFSPEILQTRRVPVFSMKL